MLRKKNINVTLIQFFLIYESFITGSYFSVTIFLFTLKSYYFYCEGQKYHKNGSNMNF